MGYLRMRRPAGLLTSPSSGLRSSRNLFEETLNQLSRGCHCSNLVKRSVSAMDRDDRKLQRLHKKMKKQRRRISKPRVKKVSRKQDHCKADVKMNCFSHDDNHWSTPPLWNDGSFCACTNSNNNTYWCVRNINSTHNYLYCEYVTGMITYSDLHQDRHQLRNLLYTRSDRVGGGSMVKIRIQVQQPTEEKEEQEV